MRLKLTDKFWEIYRKINKLPKMVCIEACSICQLNCCDCHMRKNDSNIIVGNGYLKFKDFKNFIDKNPYIKKIELSFCGEIFLNPELNEIIKYAYKKNVELTALNGVNFNTVSDETLETLVKYKFKGIKQIIQGYHDMSSISEMILYPAYPNAMMIFFVSTLHIFPPKNQNSVSLLF